MSYVWNVHNCKSKHIRLVNKSASNIVAESSNAIARFDINFIKRGDIVIKILSISKIVPYRGWSIIVTQGPRTP